MQDKLEKWFQSAGLIHAAGRQHGLNKLFEYRYVPKVNGIKTRLLWQTIFLHIAWGGVSIGVVCAHRYMDQSAVRVGYGIIHAHYSFYTASVWCYGM